MAFVWFERRDFEWGQRGGKENFLEYCLRTPLKLLFHGRYFAFDGLENRRRQNIRNLWQPEVTVGILFGPSRIAFHDLVSELAEGDELLQSLSDIIFLLF